MATKDQQVKLVCEGLALGTLALGVEAVTSAKYVLASALQTAWGDWDQARRFPRIAGHGAAELLARGIRRSERRQVVLAAWESGRWTSPYITLDDWSVEDCTEVLA